MEIYNIQDKTGKIDGNVYCNVWRACKEMARRELENGIKISTLDAINHATDDAIEQQHNLITWAGDWGIEKNECSITGRPRYNYSIQDAAHPGVYLHLDIQSVVGEVKAWYMTNMKMFLHRNIYPIPMGINNKDWKDVDIEAIKDIEKDKLCYANFTMTAPSRTRIAEWAWGQEYIDCNFPQRYDNQAEDLNMPILKGERYSTSDFVNRLASYQFAIAPIGNAIDTFRTWECILCNTVPIVQDSWMSRVFSKIWPMVIVKKYQFSNVFQLINDFYEKHGRIEYDKSLLYQENFELLLDRIKYESDRLRREFL